MDATKDHKVNAVALSLQSVMDEISSFYDSLVGEGQHNIILLVGAGDVEQYAANVPRERGIDSLKSLLGRWSVDLPDTLPDASTPGNTRAFEYLLNEFAEQVRTSGPDLATTRANVVKHVGELVAQVNRGCTNG